MSLSCHSCLLSVTWATMSSEKNSIGVLLFLVLVAMDVAPVEENHYDHHLHYHHTFLWILSVVHITLGSHMDLVNCTSGEQSSL